MGTALLYFILTIFMDHAMHWPLGRAGGSINLFPPVHNITMIQAFSNLEAAIVLLSMCSDPILSKTSQWRYIGDTPRAALRAHEYWYEGSSWLIMTKPLEVACAAL